MAGEEQQDDRADLIQALFALLTCRLEDAAGIAGESQARLPRADLLTNAASIQGMLSDAETLSRAIATLLAEPDHPPEIVDDK